MSETDLSRDVQRHQRYRQPSSEDDVRGMGINKYIEFRHGRDVAGTAIAPPMMIRRPSCCIVSGACTMARAMLVSGPRAMTVRSWR